MQTVEKKPKSTQEKRKPSIFRKVYPIHEPYIYAAVVKNPTTHKIRYETIEPTLLKDEEEKLNEIKSLLMEEIDVSLKDLETKEKAEDYLKSKVQETIKDYRIKIPKESIDKLTYYILRDFIGYGKIDALMKDPLIEDISADGVNIPIYVWHREYESIPTDIVFGDADELDSFIMRLAYLAGKNISIATPMLDASLPDRSRIQLTYGSEVTRRGSTFTIRRFRVDPLTISDLISFNTVSSEMAAYFWYAIENRASILVAGGVASGKTTILNCLSMFIRPELKIVSVEDTAELNLPHENWIPSVVRPGFGLQGKGTGEITLFDLLKTAVRQRPDYIIVGEVRGEEAYTLFQAMATGHLGMCTLHSESADTAIRRLESEPMNIPRSLLTMIDVIMVQLRTEIQGKPSRRTFTVTEITDLDSRTKELITNEVYHWNAKHDSFSYCGHSHILEGTMKTRGLEEEEVREELHRRKVVLEWMAENDIRNYTDVATVIREYYLDPTRVYKRARLGVK
ncbi:MAG: type II/IV secretion system ATPase subunit [Candidatus Bathyarchaeota archaeon]|nr:type II/IV secretion system ATPase subunit [Candidatus Bathyarchaeota archaeon]MDH5733112.1 type II/IV secretion system ATPase subunit [Candidatus Bathyarchaeota archaeon]